MLPDHAAGLWSRALARIGRWVVLPLVLIMAAALLARAYDTRWIGANQPLSSAKLKATLDDLQARLAATEAQVPKGVIMMWSGPVSEIPMGWHLCDGNSGTIDLRDRFVVGAGKSYLVGDAGGSATVSHSHALPAHAHAVPSHTHTTPDHSHLMWQCDGNGAVKAGDGQTVLTTTPMYATGTVWTIASRNNVTARTDTSGTATTGAWAGTTGGSAAATSEAATVENRPPYYALCYIQKM